MCGTNSGHSIMIEPSLVFSRQADPIEVGSRIDFVPDLLSGPNAASRSVFLVHHNAHRCNDRGGTREASFCGQMGRCGHRIDPGQPW